jgi:serine/threonine protein kinase/tetratricopeptide (TPR) repeat protein
MNNCPLCGANYDSRFRDCPQCAADEISEKPDALLDSLVAEKFLLRKLLGSGGMGNVYLAEDVGVGRTVAVKILHASLVGDPRARSRFITEARAASRLNHPHIVAVIDFGQTKDGRLFTAMEYLHGKSLDKLLVDEHPIALARVIQIFAQVAEAVHAAHVLNILHRDLKPENIILLHGYDDFIKVLDFGIAKILDEQRRNVTIPGYVPGTPQYMSPEQATASPLTPRSDVYSLGILLYQLITGRVPFEGQSPLELMTAHVRQMPTPPSQRCPNRNIPPSLDLIVLMALAKEPDQRMPSALRFRDLLLAWARSTGLSQPERPGGETDSLLEFWPDEGLDDFADPVPQEWGVQETQTGRPRPSLLPMVPVHKVYGREQESQRLDEFLGRDGARSLTLLGPEGVGKGRLITEAILMAEKRGLTPFHCQPVRSTAPVPLGTVRQIARHCLGLKQSGSVVPEALLPASETLGLGSESIPGLKELFGLENILKDSDHVSRQRERRAAFISLVRLWSEASRRLLICEELHTYDGASIELLMALARKPDLELAIVASAVKADHGRGSASLGDVLEIQALDETSRREWVSSMFAGKAEPAIVEEICKRSSGNVLSIFQLTAGMRHEGVPDPPAKLVDLIAGRIARLSENELSVMQALAVIDDAVDLDTVGEVLDRSISMQDVSPLVQRGLLARSGQHYVFAHPLIRAVIHSSIPAEVRKHLHSLVAELLRRRGGVPLKIADHAYQGDIGPQAIEDLQRAAAQAQALLDDPLAVFWNMRALELVRREWGRARVDAERLDEQAIEIALALADALQHKRDFSLAEGILEEVLSSVAAGPIARAKLRLSLGRMDLARRNHRRALRRLQLAQNDAVASPEPILMQAISRELARALGALGERDAAEQLLLSALPSSDEITWSQLLSTAQVGLEIGLEERLAGLNAEQWQNAASGAPYVAAAEIYLAQAQIAVRVGRLGAAENALVRGYGAAFKSGDRSRQLEITSELGRVQALAGKIDEATQSYRQARDLAEALHWTEGFERVATELEKIGVNR